MTADRDHPAVRAWRELGVAPTPDGTPVDRLQKSRKGMVYRLVGAGPSGSDVVAKWSTHDRIRREALAYEQVLPGLSVSRPRYYGSLAEPDRGGCWLFVAHAGDERYSPGLGPHRALAAEWLAALHTSAAKAPPAVPLADRGPGYYLEELRAAREGIARHLADTTLPPDDVAVLEAIVRQCDVAASHWHAVEEACGSTPPTFVHGDFAPKNIRLERGGATASLRPFDWASAGWGTPAADLPQLDLAPGGYWASPSLDVYRAWTSRFWPRLSPRDLRRLAAIGKVFRTAVCLRREAAGLFSEWPEAAMKDMRCYRADMDDALRALGWGP